MSADYFVFAFYIVGFMALLLVCGFISWVIFCVKVEITYSKNYLCVIITIKEEDTLP